jgi:hypothetical protein
MGFSNFKSEIEVAKRFNLTTDSEPFVKAIMLILIMVFLVFQTF